MLASDLLREVKLLAAEKPDTIYDRENGCCRYTRGEAGGECGCIIGQAIKRLNLDVFLIMQVAENAGVDLDSVDSLHEYGLITGDVEELSRIQARQDVKHRWRDCVWPR